VLYAYASHKPHVGYVQGMNFIVVALLDVVDEIAAFWMLVIIIESWLPEHFSDAMVGNHVDCRVLAILTAEHLPALAKHLHELDVTVQLLTTRWFLCLWSSVLGTASLHRLWDYLFVIGPAATMQAALACMHLCESRILKSRDIGDALSAAKEVLRDDDGALLDLVLRQVSDISHDQLVAWRMHCRDIVLSETRHLHATRRLLKLQRKSGFSLQELKLVARLCGPADGSAHAHAIFAIRVGFDSFARVLGGLIPHWKNLAAACFSKMQSVCSSPSVAASSRIAAGPQLNSEARTMSPATHVGMRESCPIGPSLVERLFIIFYSLPAENFPDADLGFCCEALQEQDPHSTVSMQLTFEQLVVGLGWLLRGTSKRRAELCYKCFSVVDGESGSIVAEGRDDGATGVSRIRFASILTSVYIMYNPSCGVDERGIARIRAEADSFTAMVYESWDTSQSGVLDAASFYHVAHQHPLLVQAFQLDQRDLSSSDSTISGACSVLGNQKLRVKNGVYLGLRPSALPTLDDRYFSAMSSSTHSQDVSLECSEGGLGREP